MCICKPRFRAVWHGPAHIWMYGVDHLCLFEYVTYHFEIMIHLGFVLFFPMHDDDANNDKSNDCRSMQHDVLSDSHTTYPRAEMSQLGSKSKVRPDSHVP